MDASVIEERALPVPENLDTSSENLVELIRVWWNGDAPSMNIRPALKEPGAVGVILAELAWHFSNAYAQHHGADQSKVFDDILKSWEKAHAQALKNAEGGA